MLRVYECLTQEHDLRLVVLAGLICLLASYTAYSLVQRARGASFRARISWISGAALATGSGVWSTHFIAMLAFQPSVPVTYDFGLTVASIVIAVLISGLGLSLSLVGSERYATDPRYRGHILIGGAVVGLGIAAMHYVGMSAINVFGWVHWDKNMVIASVLIGMALGGVAAKVGHTKSDFRSLMTAATLLTLGICGMHFTAMAAASIVPDPTVPMPLQSIDPQELTIQVAAVAFLILALSLAGAIIDQHLAHRSAVEAQKLRASEARFRQLADSTFEGIIIHVDGKIVDVNDALSNLVGLPADRLIGRHFLDIVAPSSAAKVQMQLSVIAERRATAGGRKTDPARSDQSGAEAPTAVKAIEIELRHADGTIIPVEVFGRIIQHGNTDARVVAVRDIRERKAAEERIRFMAHHDALTGLPNRNLFHDRLNHAIARSKRGATTVAVLCMDLDRFKNVNDLSGHAAGDELLRQVANRLSASVRAEDTVARLSGDEFAIVQVGVNHPDGPAVLADRLVKAMAKPFDLGGQQTIIGTSIGISLFPGDGDKGDELVRAADTALYRAKSAGRGTFRFFEAQMDMRLQERRLLERDLRQALATNQLEVHYQPLVDCDQVKVLGFEALVRWTHPERGSISPAEFIPLAEESGLIIPLGAWVLRTACTEAAAWPDDKIIAVNLSPAQFRHADLAREVLTILDETGLPPHRLELEITEGVLIDDTDRTLETLNTFKEAGVRISLDDFGTGYSSLSYLQRFPFDKIKIDRSFIWEMEKNPDSMSIVRAVIALGRSLRITVTAEGVETQEQLALLQNEQCDQAQGFLLGRPLPLRDVGKLLAEPRLTVVSTDKPVREAPKPAAE
ncbi:EAL domain-containing protein [Dongia soli]|uniref:EAL domain-containing protein n=1 Tax=Dongia soli TaxID=600628 RepID=A0ABU5EGC3_9PROT|nr:EAL domain-containing protein [Dongia soli]MDY0884540.1 EAL domain-containing protein [Dongia soli]